jgi:hypothetical protein
MFDDTRAQWNARKLLRPNTLVPNSARVAVSWHWAGNPTHLAGKPHTACLSLVRSWQLFHQTDPARKWKDIGYNALVCPHAHVIEGRGVQFSGSHSPSWNTSRIGVQFMVGTGERVTVPMLVRATRLHADLEAMVGHKLGNNCHHDDPKTSTECPGAQIHAWVKAGASTLPPSQTPPTQTGDKAMHLVQLTATDAVWVSDLLTRRWVQTTKELAVVQAVLKADGHPNIVKVVPSLAAYGVPVGASPPK